MTAAKIAILCLLLYVLPVDGAIAAPPPDLPPIEHFIDSDFRVRLKAADTLGSEGASAVPSLIQALSASDRQMRALAAEILGRIGPEAAAAVPALTAALQDEDASVRRIAAYTLAKVGRNASLAVPILADQLSDRDPNLRATAAYALGQIGNEAATAVPNLVARLGDAAPPVRRNAAYALGCFGSEAQLAVPALISSLQDDDAGVRSRAATALGQIGLEAKGAVPSLIESLQDPEETVRQDAADALGRIGAEASEAVPALISALSDEKPAVRQNAVLGLSGIAVVFQDKAKTLSMPELEAAIAQLQPALQLAEDPKTGLNPEDIAVLRRPLLALEAQRQARLFDRAEFWLLERKWILGTALYLLLMPWLGVLLLRLRPLWLLRLNNFLKPYTDVPLPILGVSVPIRYVLFVGFFHYRDRVLDAWVKKYIESARREFQAKETVKTHRLYLPIPFLKDETQLSHLTVADLRPTFAKKRFCLLIWGEGGSGKTATACQVGRWVMAEEAQQRPSTLMLPVLIEDDLRPREDKQPLLEAIRAQLQYLIDETEPVAEELLLQLLRKRRILVIVDGLSKLNEVAREALDLSSPDFPVNALVVTSRVEEPLSRANKTTLHPLRIEGNQLSSFLEAYVQGQQMRDRFSDSEFARVRDRLLQLVGNRAFPILLAKLYAEQSIAAQLGSEGAHLPQSIPDLMLSYLDELSRDRVPENGDRTATLALQQDAKIIAWECVKSTYQPGVPSRKDVLEALGEQPEDRLQVFENRLHLIEAVGSGKDKIRFSLPTLAEYLAALYLIDCYAQDRNKWRNFLRSADNIEGAPESIGSFLIALRDCDLAPSTESSVPPFVLEELNRRI
ncbi:MAG: HEAT repeat domain-containing protein [Cyanobacteriota bacterium]|nr:HEAT repeat domain-containing protein [Cyanobacteriota bacterium]